MKNSLLSQIGLTLLRVVPAAMMLTHGYPKLQKMLAGDWAFADPLGIGEAPSLFLTVVGEFLAPILLIIGLKTRFAALPAAITMFVASFVVHGVDPFAKKELALLYAICFTAVFFTGPGKFSLDANLK